MKTNIIFNNVIWVIGQYTNQNTGKENLIPEKIREVVRKTLKVLREE